MKLKISILIYLNAFVLSNLITAGVAPSRQVKPNISGTISNNQFQPIIGAHVGVEGTLLGTITDLNGQFVIHNLKPGRYTLHISAVGYKNISKVIDITENEVLRVQIIIEDNEFIIPEVLITGKSDRIFSKVPGSVSYLNKKELEMINPISGNEVFRRIAGVHVVDEEGSGMRVNIGIRGLDPDRSRSLLILEDGIPVALAPYGEPEMYYTPPVERMTGIEILKGSGQILYGPQTIGGVVNYLTSAPPIESMGKIRIQSGQGGYLSALLQYGNTHGKAGYNLTVLKKQADKVGYAGFDITDINGKFVVNVNDHSAFTFKADFYHETSNSTYIGLTQSMFEKGGQDFVLMAPDDLLSVKRYSTSLNHEYKWSQKTRLKTTAFAYTTSRDWRRQDFVSNNANNTKPSNWTGVTWGDETISGGAVFMRKTTANRNRQFEVTGAESRVEHDYKLFRSDHLLKAGVRYIYEKAEEQRVNGSSPDVSSGALVEDESRPGDAFSAYVHQTSSIRQNLQLHYGIRLESFHYSRDINRRTFTINGQNILRDTILNKSNALSQFIPGAGLTWKINNKTTLFAGLHTGFAPPRTKDAISNIGEVYDLSAEKSVNSELGIRTEITKGIHLELTGFHMNFSNQIIPVSESSGGTGIGLVNGGSTLHQGVESALNISISEMAGWSETSLHFNTNVTYTDAHFTGDRQQDGESLNGKSTPYAPSMMVNSSILIESINGLVFRLGLNFVSGQYGDELNTQIPSADGKIGYISPYHTMDANIGYKINKWNTIFTLSMKNMTNERYIVSRRPQGIRLGLPRWITFAAQYTF